MLYRPSPMDVYLSVSNGRLNDGLEQNTISSEIKVCVSVRFNNLSEHCNIFQHNR